MRVIIPAAIVSLYSTAPSSMDPYEWDTSSAYIVSTRVKLGNIFGAYSLMINGFSFTGSATGITGTNSNSNGSITMTGTASGTNGSTSAWLLDTFTASNGTDPIDRAMDSYPQSEFSNWRAAWQGYNGVITNNKVYINVANSETRVLLQAYNNAELDIDISMPYFVFLEADPGSDVDTTYQNFIQVQLSADLYGDNSNLTVYPGTGEFAVSVAGDNDMYSSPYPYNTASTGFIKIGLYVTDTYVAVISNGNILEQHNNAGIGLSGKVAYVIIDMFTNGSFTNDRYIESFGIYTSISVANAQAMTT